jgi:hypothetical protein
MRTPSRRGQGCDCQKAPIHALFTPFRLPLSRLNTRLLAKVTASATVRTTKTVTAMKELLTVLATWLSINFGLPAIQDHPQIEMVQPVRMAAIRYRGLVPDRAPVTQSDDDAPLGTPTNIVALYDDARKTIYLPHGWRGSPAELSVLVHELVHHIQNEAGMKFACPGEREKLAYDAQAKWLAIFGMTLEAEFDVDPFSLLVRTNCLG